MSSLPQLPRGIVPVLQTPFDAQGSIDFAGLARLMENAIEGGATGFLAPAVASEVATLSAAEREQLVRFVVSHTRGRVPLIAGCTAPVPEQCRAHVEVASKAGAAAILISPPDALRQDAAGLVAFFHAALEGTHLPLIVQDLDWSGEGLPMDTIATLRDSEPRFAGIKIECVPAGPKYTQVRERFGSAFHISGGWAIGQMIEAMDRGVDALIPEASMVPVYRRIWDLYHAGQRAESVLLFRRLLPVLGFTNQELRLSIAFFKRLLVRKSIFDSAAMRLPEPAWDAITAGIAAELMDRYLELELDAARDDGTS